MLFHKNTLHHLIVDELINVIKYPVRNWCCMQCCDLFKLFVSSKFTKRLHFFCAQIGFLFTIFLCSLYRSWATFRLLHHFGFVCVLINFLGYAVRIFHTTDAKYTFHVRHKSLKGSTTLGMVLLTWPKIQYWARILMMQIASGMFSEVLVSLICLMVVWVCVCMHVCVCVCAHACVCTCMCLGHHTTLMSKDSIVFSLFVSGTSRGNQSHAWSPVEHQGSLWKKLNLCVSYKHTSWDHLIMFFTSTPYACLFLTKVCISLHTCMSVCEHAYERRDCNRLIWWQWPAFLLWLWHDILTCMNVMATSWWSFYFCIYIMHWGVVLCIVSVIFKQRLFTYHVSVAVGDSVVVFLCCWEHINSLSL